MNAEAGAELRGGKTGFVRLALLVIAVGALVAHLLATAPGVKVSPDGATYLGIARNIADGKGCVMPYGREYGRPVTNCPPLLPAILALFGAMGADFLDAARWLNGVCFAASVLLTGWLLFWCTRNRWVALFGAFLMLTGASIYRTYVLTEPLFVALELAGLALLAVHLSAGGWAALLGSAAAVALACLTRYTGVALVLAGMLSLLLLTSGRLTKRLKRAVVFGMVSSFPLAVWLGRIALLKSNVGGRTLAVHPVSRERITQGFETIAGWLLPAGVPAGVGVFFTVAVLGVALVVGVRAVARGGAGAGAAVPHRRRMTGFAFGLFVLAYAAFVVASISFFDALTPLDGRILDPAYGPVLIFGLCAAQSLLEKYEGHHALAIALVVLCAAFGVRLAVRFSAKTVHNMADAGDFTGSRWRGSRIVKELRKLPEDRPVYTNDPCAVFYLLNRRETYEVPLRVHPLSRVLNSDYASELEAMGADVVRRRGAVAYFKRNGAMEEAAPESELAGLSLVPVLRTEEGTIYAPAGADRRP